jgi:VAD1 Analog of StAR-related lipid transfer domain
MHIMEAQPHQALSGRTAGDSKSASFGEHSPGGSSAMAGPVAPGKAETITTLTTDGTGASMDSSYANNSSSSTSRGGENRESNVSGSSNNDSGGGGGGGDDSYLGTLLGFSSSSVSLASGSSSSRNKKRKPKKGMARNNHRGSSSPNPESKEGDYDDNDQEDYDDDNESVSSSASSAAYFEPSDLNPGYWVKVMGDHAPTLALGVIAVSAAILHPILFVAGTLAMFGTYTAATAAAASSSSSSSPSASNAPANLGPYDTLCLRYAPSNKDDKAPPFSSIFCWNTSDSAGATNDETYTATSQPLQDKETSSKETTALPQPVVGVETAPAHPSDTRERFFNEAARKSDDEQHQRAFVEATYPHLDHPILNDQVFYGLSALETFKIFFDDRAPYNFIEFQKKRGDVDITYRPWEPIVPDSEDNDTNAHRVPCPTPLFSPRAAPEATVVPPPAVLAYQQRVVTFKAKTNAIFGPTYAPTTKTQRFVLLSKKWAVLESRTELSDIPFADRFFVLERWIVHAAKTTSLDDDRPGMDDPLSPLSGGPNPPSYVCRISVSAQVVFKKPCGALEGQIRSKAYSTLLDVGTAWCCMAREALNLAELAKSNRLLRQHPEHSAREAASVAQGRNGNVPVDEVIVDESVEVEHNVGKQLALRRSESEPGISHRHGSSSHQPRLHSLRQSLVNFAVRKPSFEFRKPLPPQQPMKGTAVW